MTKAAAAKSAKSATPARADAPAHDAELEALVTQAEKGFAARAQVDLVELIDASTRGVLTLFPYKPRAVEDGKTYPAMTGHLDTKRVKIPVSAFAKTTDEGRKYLSLAIGPKGQTHIGGAVFRQEEQSKADGTWHLAPGKENERFGLICKSVQVDGTDDFETVFELRFYGKRRISGAGVPYIKAQVYPQRTEADDDQAMADCF